MTRTEAFQRVSHYLQTREGESLITAAARCMLERSHTDAVALAVMQGDLMHAARCLPPARLRLVQ
jgi:hypothetical protein